jgi:hypothetical protein
VKSDAERELAERDLSSPSGSADKIPEKQQHTYWASIAARRLCISDASATWRTTPPHIRIADAYQTSERSRPRGGNQTGLVIST